MLSRAVSARLVSSAVARECRRTLPASLTRFQDLHSSSSRHAYAAAPVKPRWLSTEAVEHDGARAATTTNKEEKTPFVSTPERKYEFFQNVEITSSGVAVIRFDCPGKSVNTISFALKDEAKVLWDQEIENNSNVKAIVFASAKPNMFIAGADIFDIKSIDNKQDLVPLIEDGLNFFQKMQKKKIPMVCAIDGPALGGGLEWALW